MQQNNYLPDWLNDESVKNARNDTISVNEEQFWMDLIEKYLKPLDKNEEEEKKVKTELIALRDIAVFAFVMINALFVLIVFLLQLNKEELHVRWPLNARNTIVYDVSNNEITIQREYLELEPIGLVFVLFFGVILFIQFGAMLVHRFGTVSQILATTELDWSCAKDHGDVTAQAELSGKAVSIALRTQRPQPQWDENDMTNEQEQIGRRDTIHRIMFQHRNRVDYSNLETNFKRRFFKDGNLDINMQRISMSRKTITLLDHRRQSIIQERNKRRSQLQSLPASTAAAAAAAAAATAAVNNFNASAVDHTYNTIQWASSADHQQSSSDGSSMASQTVRKPFGSAVARTEAVFAYNGDDDDDDDDNGEADANRGGSVNRSFAPSMYDDLFESSTATRARPSRVTFS